MERGWDPEHEWRELIFDKRRDALPLVNGTKERLVQSKRFEDFAVKWWDFSSYGFTFLIQI